MPQKYRRVKNSKTYCDEIECYSSKLPAVNYQKANGFKAYKKSAGSNPLEALEDERGFEGAAVDEGKSVG